MYFSINDIPVLDPRLMLEQAEEHSLSTAKWLGKANSFVESRGVEPSTGWFLVPYETIIEAETFVGPPDTPEEGDENTVPQGAYKVRLRINLDEPDSLGQPTVREYNDMYVSEYWNITPGFRKEDCIYVIKVVDARFVFSHPHSYWTNGDNTESLDLWLNKVESYLTPAELKVEFELDDEPDEGVFVYADYSTKVVRQEDAEAVDDYELPIPYSWEEVITEVVRVCSIKHPDRSHISFPWFEKEHVLEINMDDVVFPDYIPQNLTTQGRTLKELLQMILFWTNTGLYWEGEGKLKLLHNENPPVEDSNEFDSMVLFRQRHQEVVDRKFTNTNSVQTGYPFVLNLAFPLIPQERENNEQDEYFSAAFALQAEGLVDGDSPESAGNRGWRFPDVLMPLVWVNDLYPVSLSGVPTPIEDFLRDQIEDQFFQYPYQSVTFTGGRDETVTPWIERISFFDLGDGPYTQIENLLYIDWEIFNPPRIIPRERKLSLILAKCDGSVLGNQKTFPFKEAKLILGEYPPEGTGTAYNTFGRSYEADESIVLIKGTTEEWRKNSALTIEGQHFNGYYIFSPGEFLVLKGLVSDIDFETREILLSKLETVNGRRPFSNEEDQKLHISSDTPTVFDETDEEFFIRFDFTAGDTEFNKWTFADAGNIKALMKGIGGYDNDIEEPQVISHPLFPQETADQPKVGWDKLSDVLAFIPGWVDGVEQVIGKALSADRSARWVDAEDLPGGGGGGPGGGTGPPGSSQVTICKALVNEPSDTSGAVVDFDNAVAIIGTAPDGGTGFAQNTFNLPFVDNEEILLIQRNDASWTMLKVTINILRGFVNEPSDVARTDTEFDFDNPTAVYGKAPTNAAQMIAVNPLGHEFANNDELLLFQMPDGKFYPISMEPQTGLFRTITSVGAATWNNTASELTIGSGTGRRMRLKTGSTTVFETLVTNTVSLKNMAPVSISNNKVVQAKRIGKYWFVDVEPC